MIGALLAETPALPLHTAGKYVAGAYVVLFALVLIYVAIMAIRMSRVERELGELLQEAEQREPLERAPEAGQREQVAAGSLPESAQSESTAV
ncbi:MAG TPA: hypothetical protein VHT27_08790 [Solirubrobacteraceae bacterium]|jgi:hypothetical protein|nr:hypothetical protein [Solirubrobacteraceae bacterium]